MGQEPSIKGVAIKSLVEDVRAMIDDGTVSQEEAAQRLTADDLELIEDHVLDSAWYPIESYRRLTELVRDVAGGRDPQGYIEGRGRAVASRLIEAGVYQQVDFLQRAGRAKEVEMALQNLRLTATLWNSFFNFGSWAVHEDPGAAGAYFMEVSESEAMPDVAWSAVHGFMARLSEISRGPRPVDMRREHTPDGRIRFYFSSQR